MTAPEIESKELDLDFVRQQFPFFETELAKNWAFFDNAGGSFPCRGVVDRLTRFYRENKVQPYTHNPLAGAASRQMAEGRSTMAAILGVEESTLTLGPSTTQNFNTLSNACGAFLKQGDEILVSEQDHEANIGGWVRTAETLNVKLKFWPVNPESGELELNSLQECLNQNTRIISVTHCSNIIGSINPVKEIVEAGHKVGARVVVDGVSYAPHIWPDLNSLGVDAYSFSTYKTFATHQGVMYVAPDFLSILEPQCHFYYIGNSSSHLDAAGPDHASIAALAGLGEFVEDMYRHHFGDSDLSLQQKASSMSILMQRHENSLAAMLLETLNTLPVRIMGKHSIEGRETNIAFLPLTCSPAELAESLSEKGLVASPSHFDGCRLLKKMGIDPDDGILRISFAHYNTREETLKLTEALKSILGE